MTPSVAIVVACLASFAAGLLLYRFIVKRRQARAFGEPGGGEAVAESTSLRDPVTQTYNRKHLLQRLQDNIARCDRSKERMALVLWDIDGFVHFNNTFGQKEGDRFLKKVADTIRRTLRSYDEAFRSGPDEFCALLVPADDTIARDVTARVRDTVSKHLFEGDPDYAGQAFSISAGVVFYPGEQKLPEALLHAAQQALFQSTHEAGRAAGEGR